MVVHDVADHSLCRMWRGDSPLAKVSYSVLNQHTRARVMHRSRQQSCAKLLVKDIFKEIHKSSMDARLETNLRKQMGQRKLTLEGRRSQDCEQKQ